jgi:hypothetical protein
MTANPVIWFANREVSLVPKHFIKCSSPVSEASKQWILNKTQGRYAFSDVQNDLNLSDDDLTAIFLLYNEPEQFVHFENSEDAIMYNLLWSDNK